MKFSSHAQDNIFFRDYKKAIDDALELPTRIGRTSAINPREVVLHLVITRAREDVDVPNKILEKLIFYKKEKEGKC